MTSPQLNLLKTLFINIVGWIVLLPVVAIFAVYRKIVDIKLRMIHGELYGGLFNLNDTIFFWTDVTSIYLTTVLYIKSKREIDLLSNVQNVIRKQIFGNPDAYPKLTGTKCSFGGYAYWKKYGCQPDSVVQSLKLPKNGKFNEEYLKKATAEIIETKIDNNDAVLWNFYISEKPLEDFSSDGSFCYPIVARFHHSIADGTSLVALFIRLFGDSTAQNYTEELFKKLIKPPIAHHHHKMGIESLATLVKKIIRTIHFALDLVCFAFGRLIQNSQLRVHDVNGLHRTSYSGEKITVWADESDCLMMVKKIRERTKSKFTCVISTAVSASMTDYLKRNKLPVPEQTSGVMALLLHFPSIDPIKPVVLENKAAGLCYSLPCHTSNNILDFLRNVTASMNEQLKYTDAIISSLLLRYAMGFVPVKFIDNYLGFDAQTFLLTNIPGGSRIEMFDGCILEKVVPVAPNVKGIGISFGIISYDNKLQIGVTVDKAITTNQEEVQKIANDFFRNIRLLDVASKNSC
uniref:O-acyltransferase WSD1 C-terminal domain-containing protein n=1 Tax=Dendroctonus ponderosae TaxID=77166 RepID=A0AAR5P5N4_DENPD